MWVFEVKTSWSRNFCLTRLLMVYKLMYLEIPHELLFCATLQLRNCPFNCAREMFKPSKDAASL